MRFKDLLEAPALMPDYSSDKADPRDDRPLDGRWKHVSTTDSGHKVYRLDIPNHDLHTRVVFKAMAPDGRPDVHVAGKFFHSKPDEFHVSELSAYHGNTLKAHELYHHIVKNHFNIVSDGAQSEGGKKTWERLAQKPGVAMYARPPALIPSVRLGHKTYSVDAQTGDYPIHHSAMKDYYDSRDPHDDYPHPDEEYARKFTRFVAKRFDEVFAMRLVETITDYEEKRTGMFVGHTKVGPHKVNLEFIPSHIGQYDVAYSVNHSTDKLKGTIEPVHAMAIAHTVASSIDHFVRTKRPTSLSMVAYDRDPGTQDKKVSKYSKLADYLANAHRGHVEVSHDHFFGVPKHTIWFPHHETGD